jgi:ABC-type spermidine/putrescine transport system permease subunit II
VPATEPPGATVAEGRRRAVEEPSPLPASPAGGAADRAIGRLEHVALLGVAGAAVAFLFLPVLVVVPMSFSSAQSLMFPPPGLSLRWYREFFADDVWLTAVANSLIVAGASSSLALGLGTLAAYRLVRGRFAGRTVLEANFVAPLIVPPVILAVALYMFFAGIGLLGSYPGLVVAHTVHGVPYVVLLMSVAISSFDERIEQVARSLGAPERTVFLRVLLPNLVSPVIAAWVLAFIVSFDEVILTLFLFGNRYTIPKQMFVRLELQIDPTVTAVATMLIAFSVVTLAGVAVLVGPLREFLGFRRRPDA